MFIKNYFTHAEWIYQPACFHLGNSNYTPDFYDQKRNVFIEVSGTKQAYHDNKIKYEKFKEMFPGVKFEIRYTDGEMIEKNIDGNISWEKNK